MMIEEMESVTLTCGESTATVYADGRVEFSGKTIIVNDEIQDGVTSGEFRFEQDQLWKY